MIDRKAIEQVEVFEGFEPEDVYKRIEKELRYLPERYHEEFVLDLLANSGPQSPRTVTKNWEMYWEMISDELTEEERNGNFEVL